ncbi:MAG: cupin domain-containing protein [Bacteroidota bacterium]
MSALPNPELTHPQIKALGGLQTQQLLITPGEENALSIEPQHDIVLFVQQGHGQLLDKNGEMYRISSGSSVHVPSGVAYGIWNEHLRQVLELVVVRSVAPAIPDQEVSKQFQIAHP